MSDADIICRQSPFFLALAAQLKQCHQLTLPKGSAVTGYIWVAVECHTGIICACIPTTRPLFKDRFPSLSKRLSRYGWTSQRADEAEGGGGDENTALRVQAPVALKGDGEKANMVNRGPKKSMDSGEDWEDFDDIPIGDEEEKVVGREMV